MEGVNQFDPGSTAFLILSAGQVMLMTPGVAFFYGGLVNKNSVLNIMFQSFVSLILTDIVWYLLVSTFNQPIVLTSGIKKQTQSWIHQSGLSVRILSPFQEMSAESLGTQIDFF